MYKRASEGPLHIHAGRRQSQAANEVGPDAAARADPTPDRRTYLYRLVPIVTLVAVLRISTSREILLA
jgi:hypothetical protein